MKRVSTVGALKQLEVKQKLRFLISSGWMSLCLFFFFGLINLKGEGGKEAGEGRTV